MVAARRDAMITMAVESAAAYPLEVLTSQGVQCLVVKGQAVARFHPAPSLRPYSDIDILVSPRQFQNAESILSKLGFRRIRDAEALWRPFDKYCTEGFNMHRPPSGNMDLHHHPSPWHFGRGLDFDEMFERSEQGSIHGVPCAFACARDAAALASLHLINDIGKDDVSLMTWRDLTILRDLCGPEQFREYLVCSGLEWFEPLVRSTLEDLGVPSGRYPHVVEGPRARINSARLALMGWNETSVFARHPVGWALRLSLPRALLFLAGSLVPSRRYVRSRYANYREYWNDAAMSFRAASAGTDFRHRRIAEHSVPAHQPNEGKAAELPRGIDHARKTMKENLVTWVGELEIDREAAVTPVMRPLAQTDQMARIWVRRHGAPIGYVEVQVVDGSVDPVMLDRTIREQLSICLDADVTRNEDDLGHPDMARGFADPEIPAEPVTVVVATKGRPVTIEQSLASLQLLDYPLFEVLLIDGSLDNRTKETFERCVGADPRFRYIAEPRPGLSLARNVGVSNAMSDLVAFTDDDCRVDRQWLECLAQPLTMDPNIECVTGMVPSADLRTPSQRYFDRRVWWSSHLRDRVFTMEREPGDSPLHPFRMGIYGTGANFAMRRDTVRKLGWFSELLGAGSPCRGGGEDQECS